MTIFQMSPAKEIKAFSSKSLVSGFHVVCNMSISVLTFLTNLPNGKESYRKWWSEFSGLSLVLSVGVRSVGWMEALSLCGWKLFSQERAQAFLETYRRGIS